jgi:trehalose 6-phosphate synthase/phosphatase
MTNPLVVVSNRLPFSARRDGDRIAFVRAPGGLATAMNAALENGGRWIGWSGLPEEELSTVAEFKFPQSTGRRYVPVPLNRHEVSRYYGHFANRTLWPTFHYFMDRVRFDGAAWTVYDRVNERFAQVTAREAPANATIWIHDYQLLRTPHHLRRLRPDARIAFFLHTPFPSADVFRALPWSRLLLRGMLGADYLGFHTMVFVNHFFASAEKLLGCELERELGLVHYEGRVVTLGVHPISIDFAAMDALARTALAEDPPPPSSTRLILGVDRLDYTKGIQQRLLAVEQLLERHPEHRGHIVFTQVAVPSRERVPEYGVLKREIDETVGRINGRFSDRGWSPIRYLSRSLSPSALAGLYARADIALVTPLRDGMNLVAKEYVAAQVGAPGVLILSELAGAAEELQEALLVNPFDIDGMADALATALEMPREERTARMSALRDRVRSNDVNAWRDRFLDAVDRAIVRARASAPTPVEQLTRRLGPWMGERPRAVVFVDYDGTLTPIVEHPDRAHLDQATQKALLALAGAAHIELAVVSGRSLADLRNRVPADGMTLIGNHGLEIEGPGLHWSHPQTSEWTDTLAHASNALDELRVRGAWVEQKGSTLSWHVRAVPQEHWGPTLRRGAAVLTDEGLEAVIGKAVVEGRPPLGWNKGRALLYVLQHRYGDEWPARVRALYIGDDRTDEDAFRALRGIGRSIRVGETGTTTEADYLLPDPAAVVRILEWLAAGGHLGLKA